MRQQFSIAAAFAIGVLTSTASAQTFDSTPTSGGSYTSSPTTDAASPVEPIGADLGQAVASYDMSGELFGESRYQLQVAQTANMLIAIEALRGSVGTLQTRISDALMTCQYNENMIQTYQDEAFFAQSQVHRNNHNLNILEERMNLLEGYYNLLGQYINTDSNVIHMYCHQFAYAYEIPTECKPFVDQYTQPLQHEWYWPSNSCPPEPQTTFNNAVPTIITRETIEQALYDQQQASY